MADPVLDAIDRKKQVLSTIESGLKTATETVVPFVKEDIIDPLADTFWGRVAKNAAMSGIEFLDPVLRQLDRPQNALQGYVAEGTEGLRKGWSQEQDYSFSEAIPEDFKGQYPYISGALSGTADFLGDPTMLVGGMLTKGAQKVIPNSAMKGNWAGGTSNYIVGHYADPDKAKKPTLAEKAIGVPLLKAKKIPVTDPRVQRVSRKVKGLADWGATGALGLVDSLLNPYSRALYGETGLNRRNQQLVLKNLEEGTNRGIDKAMAQAIYGTYMPLQARRTGPLAPELQAISDYSNVQNSRKFSKEAFIEGANKASFTLSQDGKKTRKIATPKKDLEFAYDYIEKAWKIDPENTSIVFKRPSGNSGEHLKDVAKKSPLNAAVRNVFLDLQAKNIKPTIENLFENLSQESIRRAEKNKRLPEYSDGREAGFKVLNPDIEHVKKNGLWLQSSFIGEAVVEGGVNVITKVLPNGRAISFISDVHDFAEKIPVVGPALGKLLPETNIAVVGPLHTDILGTKWADRKREALGLENPEKVKITEKKDPNIANAEEILRNYVNVRPSNLGVAAEIAKLTGKGMLTGSVAQNLQDTFQEPQ